MQSIELPVKLQKTAEITYLQANKQQMKSHIYGLTKGFEVRTKLRLMFWNEKDTMEGKC